MMPKVNSSAYGIHCDLFSERREGEDLLVESLHRIERTKKLFSVVYRGSSWIDYFNTQQDSSAEVTKSINDVITPFVISSLVKKTIKFYQHLSFFTGMSTSKKSKPFHFFKMVSKGVGAIDKTIKTTFWLSEHTFHPLSFVHTLLSSTLAVFDFSFDIVKYVELLELESNKSKQGRLENKKCYLLFQLAQHASALALAILLALAFFFEIYVSHLAVLILASVTLVIQIAKSFFDERKIFPKRDNPFIKKSTEVNM